MTITVALTVALSIGNILSIQGAPLWAASGFMTVIGVIIMGTWEEDE